MDQKRVVVEFPEGSGWPAGMTVDEEGKLWVAHWGGARISRWDPVTGRLFISGKSSGLTGDRLFFGGAQLDELYITTGRYQLSEELTRQPQAGGVFRIKLDIKGLPAYKFAG